MKIYADNAATTRVSDTALAAMTPCFQEIYGNPSSLHTPGQRAAEKLAAARAIFARNLHADPREITFTSGGSEADNQALRTAAALGEKRGKRHIVSTKFEHHAVLHTLQALEREGFEVTLLDIPPDGVVAAEQVRDAIRPDTCLVSVMFANNEIGTIQPIAEIGAVCRQAGVLFHTDAVQAAGHLPIDVEAMQVDLLSLSAHKFHGPKGVGVLYARRSIPLATLIHGGAQERGKRGGTEDIPGICGAAAAFDEACATIEQNAAYLTPLRDRLIAGLTAIPHTALNGDSARRLPGNVNVCFEGIEGESLLLLLDEKGIAASSGSACTSGSLDPSHVLLALGRPHEVAHGSLRLSLSHENRPEEIDYILEVLPGIVSYLRGMSPVWDELETGLRPHLIRKETMTMALYSDKVMDHFQHPRNVGKLPDADGVGEVGNAKCGDIMRMYIQVDPETQVITDVKFNTFGCGSAIATSSMATEMIKGKPVSEALQLTNRAVVEALDGLPAHKLHCSVLAEEAVRAAIRDYYDRNSIPYGEELRACEGHCDTCGH